LAVVDGVGEALARFDGEDSEAGHAEALRLLSEGFGATMSSIVRFAEDGAHIVALWAGDRFVRDPQIRLDAEILPRDTPVRSRRVPMAFPPEVFGPETAALMNALGPDQVLLVAPINDVDEVTGAVAILAEAADRFSPDAQTALQLCGELLWRHMRHHESRYELRERAEVAEILARVSGRLHEGGLARARDLLGEVFRTIGEYVGADVVATYERRVGEARPLVDWRSTEEAATAPLLRLSDEEWSRLGEGPIVWSELISDPVAERIRGPYCAGMLVPGIVDGAVVSAFLVGKLDNRPPRDAHAELIVAAVGLMGEFRVRMGDDLALVRRGVVEQCRTESAEAFINSPAGAIDEAVVAALERIGSVFGVHRVRWVDVPSGASAASVTVEWSDGSQPDAPEAFAVGQPGVIGPNPREPVLVGPEEVWALCGIEVSSTTLIVPAVVGERVHAVLTLTGDGVRGELPVDERRALSDLAGLVYQARRRAQQELDSAYRRTLDELQLRLAHRFLDRTVLEPGPVLEWVLGEVGSVIDCDLIAIADLGGTSDGETHWWCRDERSLKIADKIDDQGSVLAPLFLECFETGEPAITRSRMLADDLRESAEGLAGSEFSILLVPFRAPGVALLLGVCSFSDREWREIETALLQQVIGQLRQFIEVVVGRRRLEFDASHDALTSLANRRKMAEEFTSLVDSGRRGAILMIDVDRFKVVNDSLGHSAGDAVLVAIADRIRTSIRAEDLVGRFGGDEFAVIVADATSDLELAAAADRLIGIVREPILVGGTTVIPTCSIGIATASDGDDVESVLRHADSALYDAKAKGRDRYEFFDDAHRQSLTERLHLETALRSGVAAGQFTPWFQPEYDLTSGEVVGVEALVRWNHPTDGVLDASRFIDTAEEIGLVPELSRLVTQRGLETLRGWIDEGFDTRMRVNVAAAQLQSRELAEQIAAALRDVGVPPDRLCIEITERSLMLDPENAIDVLGAVRDLGVEVAVDDFGTGFSSLARLKHLPVDTLKIDRSFVAGIVSSATDREIVRTIIWLSKGLGLDVVAEGVEHADQAALLLELGCDRAQGWLWSPAVPAAEVPRLARV
jgi:diguanylate cyclase (GGDEF)-like protein